jgi:hypothetical protein
MDAIGMSRMKRRKKNRGKTNPSERPKALVPPSKPGALVLHENERASRTAGQQQRPTSLLTNVVPTPPSLPGNEGPVRAPAEQQNVKSLWWRGLNQNERRLLFGVVVYLGLAAVFFRWPSSVLKYVVLVLGVFFAACVPEFARKERDGFKACLILLLAAGAAGVEIHKDHEDQREREELTKKLDYQTRLAEAAHLNKYRESEVRRDELSVDRTETSPRDTAYALTNSGNGFLAKAERWSLRVSLLESRLLTNNPVWASRLLAFPGDANQKIAAYEGLLKAEAITNVEAMRLITEVQKVLKEEADYRKLGNFFNTTMQPQYIELAEQRKNLDFPVVRQRLGQFEVTMAEQLANFPVAGLYNHLGVLAMGEGATNRELAYLYTGIARDPEHIPLYESVAYAAWTIERATWRALTYSTAGIDLCEKLPGQIEAEFKEASANYAWLLKFSPELKDDLTKRQEDLSSHFAVTKLAVNTYAKMLRDRLELTFAYTSALELQTGNAERARQYAKRLYDSDTEDPEYEDTWGFVLMRFARDRRDLAEAGRLFIEAKGHSKAEDMTGQLAPLHLAELAKLLQDEEFQENPKGTAR